MKKYLFYLTWVPAMLLIGCMQDSEWKTNDVQGNYTIKAVIEESSPILSRTTVNETGQVLWTEGDKIGVFGSKSSQNVPFALESGIGQTSGSFIGNLYEGEDVNVAYYPYYQDDVDLNGNVLSLTLPSSYQYTGNSYAPMLWAKNADGNFCFKHLGGLLKIIVYSVPAGASKFVITSEGDDAPDLAGKAEVTDVQADEPVLKLTGGGSKTITYELPGTKENQLTFYVPIPVGTYPKLSVKLIMEDESPLFTKTLSNLQVLRAHLIELPTLGAGSEETISPDYVPLEWGDGQTKIQNMDVDRGEFTLSFANDMPEFKDGSSVVVLQTDTSAYLRRVLSSEVNGKQVILQTKPATMEELFRNTEFTLSIGEEAQTKLTTSQGDVISPSKIVYIYEDQSYDIVYDEMSATTRSNHIGIDDKSPVTLFNIDKSNYSIFDIWEEGEGGISANVNLTADEFVHSLTNTFYMKFLFSPAKEVEIAPNTKIHKSDIENFVCTTTLDFMSKANFTLNVNEKFEKGWDKEICPIIKGFYVFMVGAVPVYFTVNGSLNGAIEIGLEGNLSAQFGYELNGRYKLGVAYGKELGFDYINEHEFSTDIRPLELQMDASAHANVSVYPEVSLMLYDFIGPNFALVPYGEGNMKATRDFSESYCNWSSSVELGIDAQIGGRAEFFDIAEFELGPISNNIIKKEIYSAPKHIELSSPESNDMTVYAFEPIVVDFVVKDEWDLPFKDVRNEPIANVLVKFEGTGESKISSQYAHTNSAGIAQVEWTPTASGDVLHATIFDSEGEEIDKISFSPDVKDVSIIGQWFYRSGSQTAENVFDFNYDIIFVENILEFYENGTFRFEYNPSEILLATKIIDNSEQIGWGIGTHHYIVEGNYAYTEGKIMLTATFELYDSHDVPYDLSGGILENTVLNPPTDLSESFTGEAWFVGKDELKLENNRATFYRLLDDNAPWLQSFTRQASTPRGQTMKYVISESGNVNIILDEE